MNNKHREAAVLPLNVLLMVCRQRAAKRLLLLLHPQQTVMMTTAEVCVAARGLNAGGGS